MLLWCWSVLFECFDFDLQFVVWSHCLLWLMFEFQLQRVVHCPFESTLDQFQSTSVQYSNVQYKWWTKQTKNKTMQLHQSPQPHTTPKSGSLRLPHRKGGIGAIRKVYLDESRTIAGLQPTIAYDLLLGRTSSILPCSIVIFDRVDDGISATAPTDMRDTVNPNVWQWLK